MSQYKTGTATVTNGSATVTGTNTLWLANVTAGDSFTVAGDGVVYDVASVDTDTQVTLSVNYAGVTAASAVYTIARDFTSPDNFPELTTGDIETPTIITRAFRKIQSRFTGIAINTTAEIEQAVSDHEATNDHPLATTIAKGFMSGADKTKLDTVESGATADQTKADIDALNIDADTLDGIDSLGFDAAGAADTAVSDHVALADPHSQYAEIAGQVFTGNISATNLSGTNTGDQDLSGKAAIAGQTFTGDIAAPKITASTGVLFGTDTAAANTLDDYEEGTWTPTTNGDATGVISTGNNGSYYIKTGRDVTIYMNFFVTTTFTGNTVGGLPFQINHDGLASTQIPAGVVFGGDVNTVVGGLASSAASIGFYDNQDQTSEHAPNQTVGFYRLQFSYRTNQ
jgi:hypothetical protein